MDFPKMVNIVPATERRPGAFYIDHVTVDRTASDRTTFGGGLFSYVPPGKYCMLKRAGEGNSSWDTIWMSDTDMEHYSNNDALRAASGHVLIVGLGIGMPSLAMCRKGAVKSVTVLELEPEIIVLVAPHVKHRKLQIILADGKQPPLDGHRFDMVYIDIWPNICSDNWTDMKPMLAEYRKFRVKGGIVTGWMKDYVQQEHAKENGVW